MTSAREHYRDLLARYYTWMRGDDFEARVRENRKLLRELGVLPPRPGDEARPKALDLGCGSGFQSVALALGGFEVVGVDFSEALLAELEERASGLAVKTVPGDIRDPGTYRDGGPFALAVCLGDTLTHLETVGEVEALIVAVNAALEDGGGLVLQFRDLTRELEGADRALPVRLDDDERLMATFLEYEGRHVNVHDLIFVRNESGPGWTLLKSAYRKLRLDPDETVGLLEKCGFELTGRRESAGLVTLSARKV